jgi:Trypsin-co-occurring domain 2
VFTVAAAGDDVVLIPIRPIKAVVNDEDKPLLMLWDKHLAAVISCSCSWRRYGVPAAAGVKCAVAGRWLSGGAGMVDADGNLPSLAETIAAVRRELSSAQTDGAGQAIQFRTGPVELEFEVAVTRTGGGEAGVRVWVLTLGAKGELGHATTQRITVTLQPVNPQTGKDAQIGDEHRGPGLAGPPP